MILSTLYSICVGLIAMAATIGVIIMLAVKFDKRLTRDDDDRTRRD